MNNNFDTTVESLFKGMDSFISTKTVVGDAVTIGDTIILPLVDVSFGVGAGAFSGEKKIRVNFAGKLIKTFSLKKPGGIDISESEFTLKAGDSAFFEVKE